MGLKKEGNLADSKLLVFCDASFTNMSGGVSQGGYIIFWSDAFENSINPIVWQLHRIRIVTSTLAAEASALIEASGKVYWVRCIISEIFPAIPMQLICLTDSKTLYHAVKLSKQIADKRLSKDLAMIKEKCENKEI